MDHVYGMFSHDRGESARKVAIVRGVWRTNDGDLFPDFACERFTRLVAAVDDDDVAEPIVREMVYDLDELSFETSAAKSPDGVADGDGGVV